LVGAENIMEWWRKSECRGYGRNSKYIAYKRKGKAIPVKGRGGP
jgi:hypothetical protein